LTETEQVSGQKVSSRFKRIKLCIPVFKAPPEEGAELPVKLLRVMFARYLRKPEVMHDH